VDVLVIAAPPADIAPATLWWTQLACGLLFIAIGMALAMLDKAGKLNLDDFPVPHVGLFFPYIFMGVGTLVILDALTQ
jgi:hypothetical protein